jgi:hypothetical protein
MIIYSITTIVKKDIEKEWLKWMKEVHIPNIMKTGYFNNYKIYKVRIPTSLEGESSYILHYECETIDDYLTYAEREAPRLQAEYLTNFVGKVSTARTVIETVL